LRALEREAKTQRELLQSYLAKYNEASARDSINAAPPEARIISRATPALVPAYPKKTATILIAAFAGFMLSADFIVTGALLGGAAVGSPGPVYPNYAAPAYAAPGYGFAPAPVPMQPAAPPMRHVHAPPLIPAVGSGMPPMSMPMQAPAPAVVPLAVSTLEDVVHALRSGGERRVAIAGSSRNAGTTYAAIVLARMLAQDASVVLVDLALASPNISVISIDPNAPGIAELVRGTASFAQVITRDQASQVHLIAAGQVGHDAAALTAAPMLATTIEGLAQSYDHVLIDIGAVPEIAVERLVPLARRGVLVAADPSAPATRAARERLMQAGLPEVLLIAGAPQHAAAQTA
jgi:tyrosine-protein kinase Etk/Wzc